MPPNPIPATQRALPPASPRAVDDVEERARELLAALNSITSEQRYGPEVQHQRKLRAIVRALSGDKPS